MTGCDAGRAAGHVQAVPPNVLSEHAPPMCVPLLQRKGEQAPLQAHNGVGAMPQRRLNRVASGQAGRLQYLAASWTGGEAGGGMGAGGAAHPGGGSGGQR